jgi:hypothetical protein
MGGKIYKIKTLTLAVRSQAEAGGRGSLKIA